MLRTIQEWSLVLLIIGAITLFGNWLGYGVVPTQAIPGMIVLSLITVVGLALNKLIPVQIPAVAYIQLLALSSLFQAFQVLNMLLYGRVK